MKNENNLDWYELPCTSSAIVGTIRYCRAASDTILCYAYINPRKAIKSECITMLPCGFRPLYLQTLSCIEVGGTKSRVGELVFNTDGRVYFSSDAMDGYFVVKTFIDAVKG